MYLHMIFWWTSVYTDSVHNIITRLHIFICLFVYLFTHRVLCISGSHGCKFVFVYINMYTVCI